MSVTVGEAPSTRYKRKRSRRRSRLAIHVGDRNLKLLELSPARGKKAQILSIATRSLSKGSIKEGRITDIAALSADLQALVQTANPAGVRAILSIPSALVMVRKITLAASASALELEELILAEAARHFTLEDAAFDFLLLGSDESGRIRALLAACRREDVETLQRLAKTAGLEGVAVDLDCHALSRGCGSALQGLNEEGEKLAIADLDPSRILLAVVAGGEVLYYREQQTENLALPSIDALSFHQDPGSDAVSELETSGAEAARQISRALRFYSGGSEDIRTLALTGEWASIPGLPEILEKELSVKVRAINPLAGMRAIAGADSALARSQGSAFAIAYGLVLSDHWQ